MKILVVDDDKVTRDLLSEILAAEKFDVKCAPSGEAAVRVLASETFPIVLSDIRMLELGGVALLSHIKRHSPQTVVILMTGFGNMDGAIEAIQKGAFDYISKPFRMDDLKSVLSRAADHWRALQTPAEPVDMSAALPPRSFIGKSSQIVEVYKTLARATLADSNVLITGESGTGKELVARAIHDNSRRRQKPFVAINCGALVETLLESELFGYVKGAFTGAVGAKRGLFDEADGGTIFLDEIGDVTPSLQVKLLRVLQEGEIRAVGSTENRRVDVRVMAATRVDLESAIRVGIFREDLYYRLKVISIYLPPLRERLSDLPELIHHFLVRYSDKTQKKISHVSEEALALLQRYPWPGNIRELEHAIERAIAMTRTHILYPEDFPNEIRSGVAGKSEEAVEKTDSNLLEEVEKNHILKVLQETNYNKSKAAAILGIDRKTLHRKAQRYKIQLQGEKGSENS